VHIFHTSQYKFNTDSLSQRRHNDYS
jgi:hypothetical protein